MRKLIASVALVTAVAVGGLAVAAVNPLQLVSAKSSTTTAAQPASAATAPGGVGVRLLDQALAGVVQKGTITKEQAVAVKQAIVSTVKEYRATHKGLRRPLVRKALKGVVEVSAKTIGIPPKTLVAELKSGHSIAQVAQSHNVQPSAVITALVNAGDKKVDAAVAAHKIDAARAAKIKQRLPELAAKIVNRVPRNRGN